MSEPNRPLKVFLCHASADKPAVRELYQRLEADGVDAWLDSEDLIPGQNWRVEIPNAVRDSDVVLICLSDSSVNKEGYVQKEIAFALDKAMEMPEGRIFLIPVRLEACEVPRRLDTYQWVDLFSENGYERLMLALKLRAEQIGAEPPGRKSWVPLHRQASKSATSKPKQATPVIPREEKPVAISMPEMKVTTGRGKKRFKFKNTYFAVLIGMTVVIIAVWLGSPFFEKWFTQVPAPAVTETVIVQALPTIIKTISSPITPALTPKNTFTSTATLAPTGTFTSAPAALPTEITDSKDVQMRLVSAGEFTMGSNNGNSNEQPAHQVYLDAFYIDKYEVTNALYKVCFDAGVCGRLTSLIKFNNPKYAQHPVVYVNWNNAKIYCEWRGSRLPTEAEWEKAARSVDGRTYPWGEYIDGTFANYNYYVGDTTSVGSYPKDLSPYGVYDMAGNVLEWVADWYSDTYYTTYPSDQWPPNPLGPNNAQYRVLRGGSSDKTTSQLRVAIRSLKNPLSTTQHTGFRCAKSAP